MGVWTVAALCSVVPAPIFNLVAVLRRYRRSAGPSITAGMVALEPQHGKIQGFTVRIRFPRTARLVSGADGVSGYLLRSDDFAEGGYEATWALLAPEAIESLRVDVLRLLQASEGNP